MQQQRSTDVKTRSFCPQCGVSLAPNARFCGNCGVLRQSSCQQCGMPLTSETFCEKCGVAQIDISYFNAQDAKKKVQILSSPAVSLNQTLFDCCVVGLSDPNNLIRVAAAKALKKQKVQQSFPKAAHLLADYLRAYRIEIDRIEYRLPGRCICCGATVSIPSGQLSNGYLLYMRMPSVSISMTMPACENCALHLREIVDGDVRGYKTDWKKMRLLPSCKVDVFGQPAHFRSRFFEKNSFVFYNETFAREFASLNGLQTKTAERKRFTLDHYDWNPLQK